MKRTRSTGAASTVLFDVWLITHLTGRLLDDALRPLGLTGDEFGLYSLLYQYGPATPTQVSRWTGMAPTTVSSVIRRTVARGHAEHTANPDDARSRLLRLTTAGAAATGQAAGVLGDLLPRLHRALGGEPAAVRAGLATLDEALRQLVGAAPRPYGPPPAGTGTVLSYPGTPLSPAQCAEVRRFIDWIRYRDGAAAPG